MDFQQIIYYRLSFLNLGFCTILTVLVLLTTILCWSVAIGFFNSDLCSLRRFRLHSSKKDAEYQNNH